MIYKMAGARLIIRHMSPHHKVEHLLQCVPILLISYQILIDLEEKTSKVFLTIQKHNLKTMSTNEK